MNIELQKVLEESKRIHNRAEKVSSICIVIVAICLVVNICVFISRW